MPKFVPYSSPGRCLLCGTPWQHGPLNKRFCCLACARRWRVKQASKCTLTKQDTILPAVVAGRTVRVACLAALARLGLPLDLPLPRDLLD